MKFIVFILVGMLGYTKLRLRPIIGLGSKVGEWRTIDTCPGMAVTVDLVRQFFVTSTEPCAILGFLASLAKPWTFVLFSVEFFC